MTIRSLSCVSRRVREVRRARAQDGAVDHVGFEMLQRARKLAPDVKPDHAVDRATLPRVEDDAHLDAARAAVLGASMTSLSEST